jgi:hypothetical protein
MCSITAASHFDNIHACRPAIFCSCTLYCSTSTPCSKSLPTSYTNLPACYPTSHQTPPSSYPPPLFTLFTHPDSLGTTLPLRTHRLTDTDYLYPLPLSRSRTLSKYKSHAANWRRHRQSDIANPARTLSHYQGKHATAYRQPLSRRLSYLYPTAPSHDTHTNVDPVRPSSAVYSGLQSMEHAIPREST